MKSIIPLFLLSGCSFLTSPVGLAIQQEIAEEVVEYIIEELDDIEKEKEDEPNS